MFDDSLAQLITAAPIAGAAVLFAAALWRRTAATLDYYERTLTMYADRIAPALERLAERVNQCPLKKDPPP